MATINELQDEVVEEFQDFTDWMDKYQMLIDLGNELAPLDEKYKNEQNLIDGCQSRVWLQCDYVDGKLVFTADQSSTSWWLSTAERKWWLARRYNYRRRITDSTNNKMIK